MKSEYLSVRTLRGDDGAATSRVVVAAAELTRLLSEGQNLDAAFPVAVASVAGVSGENMQTAAAKLVNLAPEQRRIVLDAGLDGIHKLFGSDGMALNFFRQQALPVVKFDFQRNGEPRTDDVLGACNRSALLAAKAVRYGGEAERDYVDFMKSVQRTLDQSVQDGVLRASDASALRTQVEEAAYAGRSEKDHGKVVELQLEATTEYMQDARNMLFNRYAQALRVESSGPSSPSVH